MEKEPHPHGNEKMPSSFWYFLIIVTLAVGGIYICTKPDSYPSEKTIKTAIEVKKQERDTIMSKTKKQSSQAAKKGDSIIKTLQSEPWKLEEKDLQDSIVREYLKNYKYQ